MVFSINWYKYNFDEDEIMNHDSSVVVCWKRRVIYTNVFKIIKRSYSAKDQAILLKLEPVEKP